MGGLGLFLAEWLLNYLRNKDALTKRIRSIEANKDGFDAVVEYNDCTRYFIIRPSVGNIGDLSGEIGDVTHAGLVVLNNEKNLNAVLASWDLLKGNRFLNIYFVNPFSSLEKQWIVSPYTHQTICDKDSLATGLKSIYATVEALDEDGAIRPLDEQNNQLAGKTGK